VSGALLAAASGVGFGVFQSLNARAVRGSEDPYLETLIQVAVAAVGLSLAALVTGELGGLGDAPLSALGDFAIAGLLHFLAGWSLLNLSQKRIGAARTSPLLTTVPVFGVAIAAVTLGQLPGAIALAAIAVMISGAYVVTMRGGAGSPRIGDALPGLSCAFCWALSPVFTLRGLDGVDSPLAGLTVGLLGSVAVYVPLYLVLRRAQAPALTSEALGLKVFLGVLVGLATWWRWAALEDAEIGIVLALGLLSVPIVLFLAPIVAGRHLEHVTPRLWLGAGLVATGALTLVVA
jgi:drug/metabolite transporter (DMT)-like permease